MEQHEAPDQVKDERDERVRQRIISYAHRVFLERGFRRMTIEELCAGLAMSKRTFYKHFSNRDELVMAIAVELIFPRMQRIHENLLSDGPVREVITRHFDLLQNELFPMLSLPLMSDVQNLMPEMWANIDAARSHLVILLSGMLRRGQIEGVVRPEINTEVVSKVVQRIVQTVADPQFVMSQGLSMQDLVINMRHVVLFGVLVRERSEEASR